MKKRVIFTAGELTMHQIGVIQRAAEIDTMLPYSRSEAIRLAISWYYRHVIRMYPDLVGPVPQVDQLPLFTDQ